MKKGKSAFTLIELLVVVALTAILATVSFLNLKGFNVLNNLQRGGETVAAALRDARQRSITQENGMRWGVHFSNSSQGQSYTLFSGPNFSSSTTKYPYALRRGVFFSNPSSSSSLDIVFNPLTGTLSTTSIVSLVDELKDGNVYTIIANTLGNVTVRLEKELTGYWTFDEGGGNNVFDSSGMGNNGVVVGNPVWADGKVGKALMFDGVDDYVVISQLSNIPAQNSPYTIFAFIKPLAYGTKGIVGWGSWGVTNAVNALRLSSSGIVNYWWSNDLSVNVSGLTDGKWHLVVATFDGVKRSIYVDGNLVGFDNPTGHAATLSNFRIGSTNNGEYFYGLIDEVRIYKKALTGEEIRNIYNLLQ